MGNEVVTAAVRRNNSTANNSLQLFIEEQNMYQYGTNGNSSHYLQAGKSKLQAQKSNKETRVYRRWNVQQYREDRAIIAWELWVLVRRGAKVLNAKCYNALLHHAGRISCICPCGSVAESVCSERSSAVCPVVGGVGGQGYPECIVVC